MKPRILILTILLALPAALFAQADTAAAAAAAMEMDDAVPGTWTVVASGGWTFPAEPPEFKDHFKTNYNFGAGIAYQMSPGNVGYGEVSLQLHYYNLLFTRSGFRKANNIPGASEIFGYPGDVYTGMVEFRGVYGTSKESISPFFTTAVGVCHIALPQRGITTPLTVLFDEVKKTTFAWSVGLGVDLPLMEKYTLFVDGKFLLGVSGASGYRLFSGGGGVRIKI